MKIFRRNFRTVAVLLGALGCMSFIPAAIAAPKFELLRVPDGGIQPQIVAQSEILHLAYFKGSAKAGDIFYVRSSDEGRSWSAPIRINSQPGSAIATGAIRGVQMAIGRNGRPMAIWNGSGSATPRNAATPAALGKYGAAPLLFSRLGDDGQFEAQRNLMTATFNLDGGGSIAADENGRAYVVWHANDAEAQDETQRRPFIAISSNDGQSFSAEKPLWAQPTGACGCCQVKVMTNSGRVHVLYRAATKLTERDTYFLSSRDGGDTFSGTMIHPWKINMCPMSSYSLTMRGDTPAAAWESNEQVFFADLGGNGIPQSIVAAPGQGNNRKYPSLAVNGSGETLLAWTEDTAWNRGGRLCARVFNSQGRSLSSLDSTVLTPVWSFPAAFTRKDGSFAILY